MDKIRKDDILEHLKEPDDRELFYKAYGRICSEEADRDAFLQRYGHEELRASHMYVKEILSGNGDDFIKEATMWKDDDKHIEVAKYSRYMPQIPAVHDFFEIVGILENTMSLKTKTGEVFLKEGDLCFIPPGTLHVPVIQDNTLALQLMIRKSTFIKAFSVIMAGPHLLSEFFINALYLNKSGELLLFHCGEEPEIENTLLKLYLENRNREPYYEMIMNSSFQVLLFHLIRIGDKCSESLCEDYAQDTLTVRLLEYIQSHYTHVTVADAARAFHFSKPYLSKYIRMKTGMPFSAIVRSIRLEKALPMLYGTSLSVAAVAAEVGYGNVEHFIRLFKKTYGETPGFYRARHKNKGQGQQKKTGRPKG